jgi:hypothetical protein
MLGFNILFGVAFVCVDEFVKRVEGVLAVLELIVEDLKDLGARIAMFKSRICSLENKSFD